MSTTTTTAPALNRRALLSRTLAGAASAAIGATATLPAAGAALVADPILALDAERRRLGRAHTRADEAATAYRRSLPRAVWDTDAQLTVLDRETDDLSRAMVAIEDRILEAVPISAAGAAVQLRLLQMLCTDCDWNQTIDAAFDRTISYLEGAAA